MASAVIMPRLGNTVESCIITKWHKKVGDAVALGDVLLTYETDKATFDLESEHEGTVLALLYNEGDDVPVLENIMIIGKPGEDISGFIAQGSTTPVAEEKPAETAPAPEAAKLVATVTAQDEIKISPRAKEAAIKTGVDYTRAVGTGPQGRIIERDIYALRDAGVMVTPAASDAYGKDIPGTGLGGRVTVSDLEAPAKAPALAAAVAASEATSEYEDVKLTNIRKVIAKAMHASLANTAQLTLHTSFDATEIMNFRARIKESAEKLGLGNITLNDIILYAVSRVLLSHKDLNAHLLD
ncbi:MAG TPA: 2-oxo acid dehydrogenase subunit E2, partial [Clostridia bacterium]|nr:2-oxo acid dehydrogenase subunit E2 [Clostridia bacterium]